MPFRLRSTESIADGLRRLAREELSSISRHLDGAAPPRDDAIHEIRKSVKKTRAILQVVGADNGRGLAKSAKHLHAISRRLSALRDADVMLETLRTLRIKDRGILNGRCFARVHRRLSSHKKSAMKAARRKGTWRRVGQSSSQDSTGRQALEAQTSSVWLSRGKYPPRTPARTHSDGPCQEKPTGRRFP